MSVTVRERLHHLLPRAIAPGRPVQIRITAAAEDRQDLCIVIVAEGHWSILGPNTRGTEWLGDIIWQDGRYVVSHPDGPNNYQFDEFRLALTYFMEYGFAIGLGLASH